MHICSTWISTDGDRWDTQSISRLIAVARLAASGVHLVGLAFGVMTCQDLGIGVWRRQTPSLPLPLPALSSPSPYCNPINTTTLCDCFLPTALRLRHISPRPRTTRPFARRTERAITTVAASDRTFDDRLDALLQPAGHFLTLLHHGRPRRLRGQPCQSFRRCARHHERSYIRSRPSAATRHGIFDQDGH